MNQIIQSNNKELRCFINQYGEAWFEDSSAKMIAREVKQYMLGEVETHVDWKTLEVNSTQLSEDAAEHFSLYVPGTEYAIPTQVYDWGIEVGLDWEREHQVD